MNKTTIIALICIIQTINSSAQNRYWVYFKNKGSIQASSADKDNLNKLIPVTRHSRLHQSDQPDWYDMPVYDQYLSEISDSGCKQIVVSHWLNAASFEMLPHQLSMIQNLSFVKTIEPVRGLCTNPISLETLGKRGILQNGNEHQLDYGVSYTQNNQINIPGVHDMGFSGKGVLVGMIDSGFDYKDRSVFNHLNVIKEYDFHWQDTLTSNEYNDPSTQHNHGTLTLSIIAGYEEGRLIGPAYGADFLLAKTEWISSETHMEEDHLVQALEWMGEFGVDVVSISLGYNKFDDGENYTYNDLDGNTTVVTRACDIAAKKGILVLSSAGNERQSQWEKIMAPADGDSVLAIGAVTLDGRIGYLSSVGPTADGRIKPDFCAMGIGTYGYMPGTNSQGYYIFANGTSLSCPLVAGLCAIMLEARPELTPTEIRDALRATSSQAVSPDTLLGWGIPDAYEALFHHGPVFHPIVFSEIHNQGVEVSVQILTDNQNSPTHVIFYYRSNDDEGFQSSVLTPKSIDEPDLFTGNIPDVLNPDNIQFYFKAADSVAGDVTAPLHAPEQLYTYSIDSDSYIAINPYIPESTVLFQNYPNPFNTHTDIMFDLSFPSHVELTIYDVRGNYISQLVNQWISNIRFLVSWDGTDDHGNNVSSGIYFIRLKTNDKYHVAKLILSR